MRTEAAARRERQVDMMKRWTWFMGGLTGIILVAGLAGISPQDTRAQSPERPEMFSKRVRIVGSDSHFKFLHREHARTKVRAMQCKDCHTLDADGVIETIPQHPQCVECHLQRADVQPQMFQCADCHLGYEFDDSRRTVSYAFTHKSHLIEKRTRKEIPCEACHQLVPTQINRFDMTLPAVRECMECHNGKISFIVYDCAKCHNPITAPDSHRLDTMTPWESDVRPQ